MVKLLAHVDLAGDQRLVSYFLWGPETLRRELYSADLRGVMNEDDPTAPLLETLAEVAGERDPLARMLHLEVRHFLGDHNLNYTDRMGMAAGVEVRVPMLDSDLVALAASMPSSFKLRGRRSKAVLRAAMRDRLPREVLTRAKTGFGAPLRRWLKVELRDLVDDVLSDASIRRRGWFDPAAIRRLVTLDRRGSVDGGYTIFALMCIELWCQMFVDRASSRLAG
jgi:asparagine synthase (glutamine-hydrolysing)